MPKQTWGPEQSYLDQSWVCRPAVNNTPDHVRRSITLCIILVYAIEAASCCGAGVLWVLSKGNCSLYTIVFHFLDRVFSKGWCIAETYVVFVGKNS
uniref:Uncharacterized protein n=1 Tax=Octopus bimaculoides TaxID=37653 RepID=A0A0L8IHY8_OCTBM